MLSHCHLPVPSLIAAVPASVLHLLERRRASFPPPTQTPAYAARSDTVGFLRRVRAADTNIFKHTLKLIHASRG